MWSVKIGTIQQTHHWFR